MARLFLETPVINGLLERFAAAYRLEYRSGCLFGRVKLPLGAATVVAIPCCTAAHLTLTLPFQEIRGEGTPAFLVSKLVSAFWGTISKQVDSVVLPRLQRAGLPHDSLTLERGQTADGDYGRLLISLEAVDLWLSRRHPRLRVKLGSADFTPEGVVLLGTLSSTNERP